MVELVEASERKAFEAWAATEWRNSGPPHSAWIGWWGRASTRPSPPTGEIEALVERLNSVDDLKTWEGCLSVEGLCKRAASALSRLAVEVQAAEARADRWFQVHDAHRKANDALGKANGELFKRAYEAEARIRELEAERERLTEERDMSLDVALFNEAIRQGAEDRFSALTVEVERLRKELGVAYQSISLTIVDAALSTQQGDLPDDAG